MKTDWKELAEKYQLEAEIYSIAYEDLLKPLRTLQALQGVVVEMYSELIKYEVKRGRTDKSKQSVERIELLLEGIMSLNGLAERNVMLKDLLKDKSLQLIKLEKEIEHLKKQMEWSD